MKLLVTYNIPSFDDNGKYLGNDVENYIEQTRNELSKGHNFDMLSLDKRGLLKFALKEGSFLYSKNVEVWSEFL